MMADEPMSDEQLEALRQALDDAVLMHTGRSIGDIASGQVARDVVGTLHAWLQQQLEQQLAIPVYGPEPMADKPMVERTTLSDVRLNFMAIRILLLPPDSDG